MASLPDAAVAIADPVRPVIYYNPAILQSTGPLMTAFIMAHEEAHITLGHQRQELGVTDRARLKRLELEADCLAARSLASLQPDVVRFAAGFFRAQGASQVDPEHPSGLARAAQLDACAR